jgi:hypothetical protein
MTASCQPLPRSVAEEMLQVVARALCDRAGDSPEQRDGRTRQMVHSTLGLAPRDGLEFMLATLAYGHFQIIMDSMSDVFRGQTDALKAKTKTTIVPLGRAMLEMIKELRLAQVRPAMQSEADARKEGAVEAEEPQHTAAAEPPPAEDALPDLDTLSEEELETLTDPRPGLPDEVIAWLAGTGPAVPECVAAEPKVSGPDRTPLVPMKPGDRTTADRPPFNVFSLAQPPATGSDNADLAAWEDPSKSAGDDIVSYPETLAAAQETLGQRRPQTTVTAKTASGD